jgi:hypothetical protein
MYSSLRYFIRSDPVQSSPSPIDQPTVVTKIIFVFRHSKIIFVFRHSKIIFVFRHSKMPKSKVWSSEERRVAAIAYLRATHDCVNGKDQSAADFWMKVEDFMTQIPTSEVRNEDRGTNAIKSFMGTIFRDINKFNTSMMKVLVAKPTGVTDQEVINIAVAIHLNHANNGRDYFMRGFDANRWPNYKAWMVLKDSKKFSPPTIDNIQTIEMTSPPIISTPTVSTGSNEDDTVEESTNSKPEATTEIMFQPIGQKQAKRERYANKKDPSLISEKNDEIKKIRLALDERNKLVQQRQETQERSQKIDDLKSLMKITKYSEPAVYEKSRKELVNLFLTPVRSTCATGSKVMSSSTWTSSSVGNSSMEDEEDACIPVSINVEEDDKTNPEKDDTEKDDTEKDDTEKDDTTYSDI